MIHVFVNFYDGNKSHFHTPDCSQTIFQANQYRPITDRQNLMYRRPHSTTSA